MLECLREYDGFQTISADVCIVGAGPAGISLARDLMGKGHGICLVESGGADFEQQTQDLYAGSVLGTPYYDLDQARLRFFGGTVNIWGGRSCPLDDIDFRPRAWVPHSGWSVSRDELLPYYERAHRDLDLGPLVYDQRCWADIGESAPAFDPALLQTGFWRFDTLQGRYGFARLRDLRNAPDVRVLCHANLTRIEVHPDAGAVRSIQVSSLCGRRARIRARCFVLACGGIENARLLLASNDVEAAGIGNSEDQVGRYFMEHPHARAARLEIRRDPFSLYRSFQRRRGRSGAWLAPSIQASAQLQEREGILNTAMTIKLIRTTGRAPPLSKRLYQSSKHALNPTRAGRGLWWAYRSFRDLVRHPALERPAWWLSRLDGRGLYLFARGEQAPNPASRIVLTRDRDALGMPRAGLAWRLCDLDKRSVRILTERVGDEFQRLGVGTVTPEPWLADPSPEWPADPSASNHPLGGYHHMGTTRMSDTPRAGVVDRDCRVHGYENLYIAGSSVFPTGGWANPTLTIVALAHRLGDRLLGVLKLPRTAAGSG